MYYTSSTYLSMAKPRGIALIWNTIWDKVRQPGELNIRTALSLDTKSSPLCFPSCSSVLQCSCLPFGGISHRRLLDSHVSVLSSESKETVVNLAPCMHLQALFKPCNLHIVKLPSTHTDSPICTSGGDQLGTCSQRKPSCDIGTMFALSILHLFFIRYIEAGSGKCMLPLHSCCWCPFMPLTEDCQDV